LLSKDNVYESKFSTLDARLGTLYGILCMMLTNDQNLQTAINSSFAYIINSTLGNEEFEEDSIYS